MQPRFGHLFFLFVFAGQVGLAQTNEPMSGTSLIPSTSNQQVAMEELSVPAKDAGVQLYVRNKHLVGMTHFVPERTLLLLHGATYPAESTFDLPLDGVSWMDYTARRGYDVYLMDVRGYGHSTRPPEMDAPADRNPPFADTETAVRDIGAVVDYILARRHVNKLDILGWSWGTATTATYASANPDKVERLVLYAAVWLRQTPSLIQVKGPLGAYRTVDPQSVLARWMTGVPEDKKGTLIAPGWFDQWWSATLATDPVGSSQNPPVLRAPNGVVQDTQKFWSNGKATYDPAKLTMPILLIQASGIKIRRPICRGLFSHCW
jgi:pimeloyl-ACP methyl ester carboxylesterase